MCSSGSERSIRERSIHSAYERSVPGEKARSTHCAIQRYSATGDTNVAMVGKADSANKVLIRFAIIGYD